MARFKQYVIFNGTLEQLNILLRMMETEDVFDVLHVQSVEGGFGILYQTRTENDAV